MCVLVHMDLRWESGFPMDRVAEGLLVLTECAVAERCISVASGEGEACSAGSESDGKTGGSEMIILWYVYYGIVFRQMNEFSMAVAWKF